jgi:hypothetical protein
MPAEFRRDSHACRARAAAADNRRYHRLVPLPMTLPTPDPAFRWSTEPWGVSLRCRPLEPVTPHLFTTRQLELRAAAGNGDAGWARAAQSVGVELTAVMRVKQVHGRTVRVLRRGRVMPADAAARPEADAQVSDDPDVVLAVQVADCVPLLLADPVAGVGAAVHAGWRGTAAAIASAALETMTREFGTRPADVIAALGPSIGECCYQVGDELPAQFAAAGIAAASSAPWFHRDAAGRLRLDLWAANRDQLVTGGVRPERIYTAGLCTQTHAGLLESYRVNGPRAGRMAGLIRPPRR